MKIVEPSAELITEKNPLKKIELAGRTCYKSEDRITEDSAKAFVAMLFERGHLAMVEHATFCFELLAWDIPLDELERRMDDLRSNPYVRITNVGGRVLVSMNARTLNEEQTAGPCRQAVKERYPELVIDGQWDEVDDFSMKFHIVDIDDIPDITKEELDAHRFMTFKCLTDRGITHEIVRHRPSSYGQESTRYCNYSKGKFGNEVRVICPSEIQNGTAAGYEIWKEGCESAESAYLKLLNMGYTPQAARSNLPTCTASEIVMTMRMEEVAHFFNLRLFGKAGTPHPDMVVLTKKMYQAALEADKVFANWAKFEFAGLEPVEYKFKV